MRTTFIRAGRLFAALALFVASPSFALARVDVIKGRIVGPDNQPMSHVSVVAKSSTGKVLRTVATDENGNFRMGLPDGDGNYELLIRSVGYLSVKLHLSRLSDVATFVANAQMNPVPTQTVGLK